MKLKQMKSIRMAKEVYDGSILVKDIMKKDGCLESIGCKKDIMKLRHE